jgi:hypothetical protein
MDRNSLIKKTQEIFTFELKKLLETKHLYQSVAMDLTIGFLIGEENKGWRLQAARDKWEVRDNATRPTTTGAANNLTLGLRM